MVIQTQTGTNIPAHCEYTSRSLKRPQKRKRTQDTLEDNTRRGPAIEDTRNTTTARRCCGSSRNELGRATHYWNRDLSLTSQKWLIVNLKFVIWCQSFNILVNCITARNVHVIFTCNCNAFNKFYPIAPISIFLNCYKHGDARMRIDGRAGLFNNFELETIAITTACFNPYQFREEKQRRQIDTITKTPARVWHDNCTITRWNWNVPAPLTAQEIRCATCPC